MGLFVDIPKPSTWPRPKPDETERIQKLMSYAQERDPIGDKIHTIFACAFFVTVPFNIPAASITFSVLVFYWLIRLPSTYRTLSLLTTNTIVIYLLLWFCWLSLSLLWSNNIDNGLDHLRSSRMMFLPILLWPIMHNWKKLVISALVGVAILNALQISDFLISVFQKKPIERTSGFIGGHPPNAGLWSSFSFIVLSSWIFTIQNKRKAIFISLILLAVSALFGSVLAGGRGNFVGLFVAVPVLVFCILKNSNTSPKKLVILLCGFAAIVSTVWLVPPARKLTQVRTEQALEGYKKYIEQDDPRTSTGIRLAWWSSSVRAFKNHPIRGVGLGGFPNWTVVDDGLDGYVKRWPGFSKRVLLEPSHPHSMYFSTLAEGGLVGIGILIAVFICLCVASVYIGSSLSFGPIMLPLVLLWFIAGSFEIFQHHGQTLAMLGLLASIASITKSNVRLGE